MANPYAGEVRLILDGVPHEMRLTLGALAEMEAELPEGTVLDLIERFETGSFATRDVLALLVAGLRGGGWSGVAGDLVTVEIQGGLVEATRAAATLLTRAFGPVDAAT